jgi:hypothetical protein
MTDDWDRLLLERESCWVPPALAQLAKIIPHTWAYPPSPNLDALNSRAARTSAAQFPLIMKTVGPLTAGETCCKESPDNAL